METTFEEKPAITGRGGYRPGSGRPKGKKNVVGLKKAILEYTSPQELKNMVERAKKLAKNDKYVLMWYLEQIFGKAKATGAPTKGVTNNIALFLDTLEKESKQLPPVVGTVIPTKEIENNGTTYNGQETVRQSVETPQPVFHNGFQAEESEVRSESSTSTLPSQPS